MGDIAITQDFRPLSIPATFGMRLIGTSGAGFSFRDVSASNGTTATITILGIEPGIGIDLADRLFAGVVLALGNASLDGP